MRKFIFITLVIIVTANLIILTIALTNPNSYFYPYRLILGISMLTFGGFLRQQFVSNKKIQDK